MEKMKWLYPGMGVKRWLALLVFGVFWVAIGLAVLLNTPVLSVVEYRLLTWLHSSGLNSSTVGVIIILLGFVWIGLAVRCGIHSVVCAIRPDDPSDLVSQVYKQRNLQKGPHIVAIGGGTGLSTMLRGLKEYSSNITAIVTVADDGGSSGRIRKELGILPPGDIRNTLIALADTEPLMEKLFQYRFSWGDDLTGHSFGNLFIAAMTDITGDFEKSIKEFSKVLAVRGKVIPSTLETVRLRARYTDGTEVVGESNIPLPNKRIDRIYMEPEGAQALPEALEAIAHADIIVLGPGSLFTSIIPNLLVEPIVEALANSSALRLYICNVMTQPGETDGMSASDHVKALLKHADGERILDYVLVNRARISPVQAEKYRREGAYPVRADTAKLERMGLEVISADFLDKMDLVRHDSDRLAKEIIRLALDHRENGKS